MDPNNPQNINPNPMQQPTDPIGQPVGQAPVVDPMPQPVSTPTPAEPTVPVSTPNPTEPTTPTQPDQGNMGGVPPVSAV